MIGDGKELDEVDDDVIIQLQEVDVKMNKCGCFMRRYRNPITRLIEWDFADICLEHQSMKEHHYEDWQWYVAHFQKKFYLPPSLCYCECHQIHPEGLKNCEGCRCWWVIQKNFDSELAKDNEMNKYR